MEVEVWKFVVVDGRRRRECRGVEEGFIKTPPATVASISQPRHLSSMTSPVSYEAGAE